MEGSASSALTWLLAGVSALMVFQAKPNSVMVTEQRLPSFPCQMDQFHQASRERISKIGVHYLWLNVASASLCLCSILFTKHFISNY
jgi:hypothetical protein